jgi:hypothetical protein
MDKGEYEDARPSLYDDDTALGRGFIFAVGKTIGLSEAMLLEHRFLCRRTARRDCLVVCEAPLGM